MELQVIYYRLVRKLLRDEQTYVIYTPKLGSIITIIEIMCRNSSPGSDMLTSQDSIACDRVQFHYLVCSPWD